MKTLIKIGYTALLVEGNAAAFIGALEHAQVVETIGYGKDQTFKPSSERIEIELILNTVDDTPVLNALKEAQKETNDERSKRYAAEGALAKLKKQFNLEDK